MELRDLERPRPVAGEVLLQVAYSGICGSELSGFMGKSSIRKPPLVFGHELSGFVAEVGPGTHAPIAVGSRVTVNPLLSCTRCEFCVTGRAHLCQRRRLLGAAVPGSNAEYVVVPAGALEPLPDDLALSTGSMAEPAACAIHAVSLSRIQPSDSALVVGAGPIGLFIVQVLKAFGVATILVAERNPDRLRMAEALGATAVSCVDDQLLDEVRTLTHGRGVYASFDASGTERTRLNCAVATAPGGRVMLIGLHAETTTLPINNLIRSEIAVQGVFAYTPQEFRTALAWLTHGRLGLADGVVSTDLADGPSWYQRLVDGDPTAKVLLQPNPLITDSTTDAPV
jgi:threonine dehydrogenase-like Zn-dependent dehydrogenase